MHTRRVTRFRPKRSRQRNPSFWRRVQLRWGAGLLLIAGLAISALLAWMPFWWATEQLGLQNAAWSQPLFTQAGRLEEHWVSLPPIPELRKGDEPEVRALLQRQPLLAAIQDRRAPDRLWIRQGDRLVKAGPGPDAARCRAWVARAEAAQRFQFVVSEAGQPVLVLLGDRWSVVKRWELGSPDVERALRVVFPSGIRFRIGLRRPEDAHQSPVPEPWGAEPHLQADRHRLAQSAFAFVSTSDALADWELVAIPWKADERRMMARVLRHFWGAWVVSAAVALSLAGGLWLRRRARLRATLDADRLATLTHSLKTPLAILKFRCDSIRLGRLKPEQEDAELIKLSEEVDRLTLIIEHGLEAIRGTQETGPQGEVSPAWLQGVAEDLAPAFAAEGRELNLDLCSEGGRAALPSLRAALLTLLENALFHGRGPVHLESQRVRKRLMLRVRDAGEGLEAHQVEGLGRPFLRLRRLGGEGFAREGQGLGLSLLVQVARKEGWGLSFASAPARGFVATIEIPAL